MAIFLGDSGASFIGFTLAGLAVMGEWAEDDGEWLAYTGKDHLHHRFEALGLSQTQSVLLIIAILESVGRGRPGRS